MNAYCFYNFINATSISIEQPIGGPVTRIDAASKTIEVMGQAVRLGPDTSPRQLPKVGDSVAVSGFVLPNGAIQASRIDPMAGNAPAFASGRFTDSRKVLNVPVDAKFGASAASGKAVRVTGQWDGSRLNAASVKEADSMVQLKPGAKFHVQAYVSDNGRAIQATGKEIPGLRAQVGELREAAGKVAVLRGQIDSTGRAEIQSIESVPVEKILDRGGRRQLSDDSQEKEFKRAEKKSDDLQREVERLLARSALAVDSHCRAGLGQQL